jgi:acyl carrier protein
MLAVEREFGCLFETDEINEFLHVGGIISTIRAKID